MSNEPLNEETSARMETPIQEFKNEVEHVYEVGAMRAEEAIHRIKSLIGEVDGGSMRKNAGFGAIRKIVSQVESRPSDHEDHAPHGNEETNYHQQVLQSISDLPKTLPALGPLLEQQTKILQTIADSLTSLKDEQIPGVKQSVDELKVALLTRPEESSVEGIKAALLDEKEDVEVVQDGAADLEELKKQLLTRENGFWTDLVAPVQAAQASKETKMETKNRLRLLLQDIGDNLSFFNEENQGAIQLMSWQEFQDEALSRIDAAVAQIR